MRKAHDHYRPCLHGSSRSLCKHQVSDSFTPSQGFFSPFPRLVLVHYRSSVGTWPLEDDGPPGFRQFLIDARGTQVYAEPGRIFSGTGLSPAHGKSSSFFPLI